MGSGAGGGWRCSLGDGSHCEADSIVRSTAPYCCRCLDFHPEVSQGHKIKVTSVAVLAWYGCHQKPCFALRRSKLPAILELLPSAEGRSLALTTEEPCHYCMHNGYSQGYCERCNPIKSLV